MKCTKCKNELRIAQEQIGVNEQNYPIMKTFAYCDKCKTKYDYDELLKKQPKPNSALSVWALVLSLLGCTSIVGGILGVVDLCINDKTKRHIGSWFAIIFSVLFIITGGTIISCSGSIGQTEPQDTVIEVNSNIVTSEENTNSESLESEKEEIAENENNYYTEGQSFETSNLKITINSVDLDYDDYDDEYGWYTPEEGMKYVYVSFTYENIGDTDAYASIYDYDCYADGALMEQTYNFNGDFINANLSSGRNVSFETCYVVPVDAQEIELEYSELISWSDEKIIIKLQ